MSFAAEILIYYLKHSAAIAEELSTPDTQALALALHDYGVRWKHSEALLKNPMLLERGEEQHQAATAAFPVLEAMMFAAGSIPEDGMTRRLYKLPSFDEDDNERVYFIDQLMEKLATQWATALTLPPDSAVQVKWGCFAEGRHQRTLKLYLCRGKVVKECGADGWITGSQASLGEDLHEILRHLKGILSAAERTLSWKFSWPDDKDVLARRAADDIMSRATSEELELLQGRSDMLAKAYQSARHLRKSSQAAEN